MIRPVIYPALLAAALVLWVSKAEAQTTTGTRTCDVAVTNLVFGTVLVQQRTDSTGSITLTCNGTGNNNPYSVAISEGGSNSFLDRFMFNGNNTLRYNLFIDPAHRIIWGNGLGETQVQVGTFDFKFNRTESATLTVYGEMPVQALPPPGRYTDVLLVTVVF